MACLVFMLLLLSMANHSFAAWCICNNGSADGYLQAALDYACANGADCSPINSNGGCANPNTVRDHCSYAVNSYFQKKNQVPSACSFSGAASIVASDPSQSDCLFPSTASSTPTITPPTPGMGYGVQPPYTPGSIGTPYATGVGLGDTDISDGGVRSPASILMWSSIILTFSALVFW